MNRITVALNCLKVQTNNLVPEAEKHGVSVKVFYPVNYSRGRQIYTSPSEGVAEKTRVRGDMYICFLLYHFINFLCYSFKVEIKTVLLHLMSLTFSF